ncbi:uncharacterized protein BDV14DRAFT_154912 [Aspergillus stella-maris]|uniref:uncharacterized protein n=1 Tax=Aspergillus stella-maris TaxID=1810926 RepID=UPI003CCE1E65
MDRKARGERWKALEVKGRRRCGSRWIAVESLVCVSLQAQRNIKSAASPLLLFFFLSSIPFLLSFISPVCLNTPSFLPLSIVSPSVWHHFPSFPSHRSPPYLAFAVQFCLISPRLLLTKLLRFIAAVLRDPFEDSRDPKIC